MSDKKRVREDDFGFGSSAAKIAAKLGADITVAMGDSLEFINETLKKCKTLEEFEDARIVIGQRSQQDTMKIIGLTMEMAKKTNIMMTKK